MTENAKELVVTATSQLFSQLKPDLVDLYFGPSYIQHNPGVADGVEGLKGLVRILAGAQGFSVTTHRVIAENDLVAMHVTYHGFGPDPLVAFDIFRVENGRIVEHWDGLGPETPPNPSGRLQTDGPTEIKDLDKTGANRALVTEFVTEVLLGGRFDRLTSFISTKTYHQHNSAIADGLDGLGAAIEALGKQGVKMEYHKLHRVIAEGNFVLTQSEGAFGGEPTAYYDLFRVEDGLIVEHWDVMQPIAPAAQARNGNGLF
ncbi:polyketide cyclase [Alsobacter metallidurans]|uniref:Polyketide cyclase n=1 Tax=Alsobacter metallidurans TaxID=340221 RepID=A0A917I4X6_9HYPH|nr:nuclear transport factor 2 family protein [Alsobacter metallidurans]GGH11405.1 polyketide cyclase [Alsobacter metallidurans]